jgi:hypothetical protein
MIEMLKIHASDGEGPIERLNIKHYRWNLPIELAADVNLMNPCVIIAQLNLMQHNLSEGDCG